MGKKQDDTFVITADTLTKALDFWIKNTFNPNYTVSHFEIINIKDAQRRRFRIFLEIDFSKSKNHEEKNHQKNFKMDVEEIKA